MTHALGRLLGAISLILMLGLAGCPTPIPTCKSYKLVKPGIDLRITSVSAGPVPQGYASVFGQIAVTGAEREGSVWLRLISYKEMFGRTVYGEKELPLHRDGRFSWVLPIGHYALQPLYFHYDYSGHQYRSIKSIDLSLEFDAPESGETYFLGRLNVSVTPELKLAYWSVSGEGGVDSSAAHQSGGVPAQVSLLRQGSDTKFIVVPVRKICQKWNMPSWCVAVPYGGCFDVDIGGSG